MAACPNCQQQLPEISTGKFCPFCGSPLNGGAPKASEPIPIAPQPLSGEEKPRSQPPSSSEPSDYVSWEDRRRLGFLPAFSQTWSDSVFRPSDFFRRVPKSGNLGAALLYGCLIGITGSMLSLFWTYWFWDSSPDMEKLQNLFGGDFNRDTLGFVSLIVPFMTVVLIFVAAFIYHICLMITGSSKNGFEATLRGYCYSYGPHLLAVIPQCGGIIAFIWQCVLLVIAWREMHESTTGRVLLAVLLPLIFCCGLTMILILSFAGMISRLAQ